MLISGYSRYLHDPDSVNAKISPVCLCRLDGPARLAAQSNHEEAGFNIDLVELEGDAVLVRHERQVALGAKKGCRGPNREEIGTIYGPGFGQLSCRDC